MCANPSEITGGEEEEGDVQWLCDQNGRGSASEAPQCPVIPGRATEESPTDGQLTSPLTTAAGGQEAELQQVAAQVKT